MIPGRFTGALLGLFLATSGAVFGAPVVVSPTPTATPIPAPTPAPVVYDLQGAINRSINNFAGLDIARKSTEAALHQLNEAKHSWILPQIDVTSLFGPVPNVPPGSGPPNFPAVTQDTDDIDNIFFRLDIEAIQPIYTFGRLTNATRLARVGVNASRQDELDQLHELVFNMKRAYFGLGALNTIEAFLREIDVKLGFVEKRIDQLLKKNSSDVTESDRLKVLIFRADLSNRQLETQEGQLKIRRALALLLGYGEQIDGWEIQLQNLEKVEAEPITMDAAIAQVRNNNASIKRLQYLVDARKHLMNIAEANMLPVLFIGGTYNLAVAPGREDVHNPFLVDEFNDISGGVAFGLRQSLSLHILRDRYLKAKVEYEQATFQRRLAEEAILSDVRGKVNGVEITARRLEVTTDGLRAARSWVGAEMNNYEFGLTPTKDVLEAFIAYAKTKLDFIDATLKYDLAIASLTRSTFHELYNLRYNGDGR